MSFWMRLLLSLCLLLFLSVPLSATYQDSAQSLPAQTDEDQPVGPDDGTPAGDDVPGAPAPAEPQEEDAG